MTQKIIKVGSSLALTIPREASTKHHLTPGREVTFSYGPLGELIYKPIEPYPMATTRQEKIAEITMNFIDRYRKDLEALKDK